MIEKNLPIQRVKFSNKINYIYIYIYYTSRISNSWLTFIESFTLIRKTKEKKRKEKNF